MEKELEQKSLNETQDAVCCPKFDPTNWNEKMHEWNNKMFIKDHVFTLFNMPINFGAVMKRMNEKIEKADAKSIDWLSLSEHTSKWNMNLYTAVDKEVSGTENTTLSGKFYSQVFEGSYQNTGAWIQKFTDSMKDKGFKMKKMYMWYTTCPKCAKKYGKNYTVIFGEIE